MPDPGSPDSSRRRRGASPGSGNEQIAGRLGDLRDAEAGGGRPQAASGGEGEGVGEAPPTPSLFRLEELHQTRALDALDEWGARLSPPLREGWSALAAGLRLREGRGYFLHPLALPVIQLPLWLGAGPARLSDARIVAAIGAAVAGYLHVRIQDDLLDEGEGLERHTAGRTLMLAEALLARHHRLLVEASQGQQDFAVLTEESWIAYAQAMALESALAGDEAATPIDEAVFKRLLDRSAPLLLPPASLLGPGLPGLADLTVLCQDLARSHQLFTDMIDAERDLRNGNRSFVLDRMGAAAGSARVAHRLYAEGGLDEVMTEALAALDRAMAAADRLGLEGASAWAEARRRTMEQARQQAFEAFFRGLLG